MSANVPDGWSSGELIGVAAPLVIEVLDCSHWESDIPDDQWCTGELVGVSGPFVTETLDCSHWELEPAEPATAPRPSGNPRSTPAADPAG